MLTLRTPIILQAYWKNSPNAYIYISCMFSILGLILLKLFNLKVKYNKENQKSVLMSTITIHGVTIILHFTRIQQTVILDIISLSHWYNLHHGLFNGVEEARQLQLICCLKCNCYTKLIIQFLHMYYTFLSTSAQTFYLALKIQQYEAQNQHFKILYCYQCICMYAPVF